MLELMSLILSKNKRGQRTVLWGIPDRTCFVLDVHPSTETLCVREVSQVVIYL